jgi:hypothetical protein
VEGDVQPLVSRGYIQGVGHNPELFDQQAKEGIVAEIGRRSVESAGWLDTGNFKKMLEPFWRATLERRGDNQVPFLDFEVAESTLRGLMAQYIPEKLRQGDKQNAARFRVRVNSYPSSV